MYLTGFHISCTFSFLPCKFCVEKKKKLIHICWNLQFLQLTPASDFIRLNWVILLTKIPFVFVTRLTMSAVLIKSRQLNIIFVYYPMHSKNVFPCQSSWWISFQIALHSMDGYKRLRPQVRTMCQVPQSPRGLDDQFASLALGIGALV